MRLYNSYGNKCRNVIFIGDSYQVGVGNDGISFLTYIKRWSSNKFGKIYDNAGGGYGFAKNNMQFITLLKELEGHVGKPERITDIVVTGGYNDHNNPDGVQAEMKKFREYANKTYPNATLWVAPVGWTSNPNMAKKKELKDAILNWIKGGDHEFYNVMTNIVTLFRDPSLIVSDSIHPTNAGQIELHHAIMQCLEHGSCEIYRQSRSCGYVKPSYVSNDGVGGLYSWDHNGVCTFCKTGFSWVNLTSARTFICDGRDANKLDLGTIPKSLTQGATWPSDSTAQTSGTHVDCIFQLKSGGWENVGCFIFIRRGHLYISGFAVDENDVKGGYKELSITNIVIPSFEIIVNNLFG